MNKEKLAKVMDVVFDDCDECPFCDFCEISCSGMWERFFEAKLNQKGKIKWPEEN